MVQGMTIKDAACGWVSEMNAYPQGMIQVLMDAKPYEWQEVTLPRIGDRVYFYNTPIEDSDGNEYDGVAESGEIAKIMDSGSYIVELDDGTKVKASVEEIEIERDSFLPMWGTMWSFGDPSDDYWLEELGGIKTMSECGFRIYENDDWGYFFGIDGCGYSFYEEHWIPLYKARGLHWHDPAAEQNYQMYVINGYEKRMVGDKEYWCDGDEIVEEVLK